MNGEKGSSAVSVGYIKELKRQKERKEELKHCLDVDGFSSLKEAVLFEAGCGHGHWLTSFSKANPDTKCVGIDLIAGRISKANAKKEKRSLENVYFYKAELLEFLEMLPPKVQFSNVVFLFPDPWPKARHHKKRMIQKPLLERHAQRMSPGGKLYFRTDDRSYFEWTCDHIEQSDFWEMGPQEQWIFEEDTYFQNLMGTYFSVVARVCLD